MLPEDRKAGGLVAPPVAYRRSDVEYSPSYMTPLKPGTGLPRSPKRSSKLPVYIFTMFVLLCAVFLVFVLVVRPRSPQFRLSEVSVKTLAYTHGSENGGSSSSASLNATLVAKITVSNPNFGRFDHENATLTVVYEGGLVVGEKAVGQERVGARRTRRVELAVDVGAPGGALGASGGEVMGNFTRDVGAGLVKLRSYGRVSGKVYLMGSGVNRRKTAVMDCEMKLNLNSRSVQDLVCQ